jgi:short-subunit dehydrogenase
MIDLRGKRTLITGASSGIGRALAFEFTRRGAIVVMAARRLSSLEEAAGEITRSFGSGASPLVVTCDVTQKASVRRLIKVCARHLGGLDILVNNAGGGVYGETERTSLEDFRSVMEVNYFGALNCLFEALPLLRTAGKGLIVNVASVAAKHGVPYLAAYGASKAALASVSQSLRAELCGTGISVMVVYPGYTETDFFAREKKVGGAVRPRGPYAPAPKVARSIVDAVEREKTELVLSWEGKALSLFQRFFPRLVDKAVARLAGSLRETEEVVREQT